MRIIGITGGVGAGKSEVLQFIQANYNAVILMADNIANEIKMPGQPCYEAIVALLGNDVLLEDGTIDKAKMATRIFGSRELLQKTNEIIHPAVRTYILEKIASCKQAGQYDYLFVEAALLIEEHYDEICDELWYVYADEPIRCQRLKQSRGYSQDKIDAIMAKQLPDDVFRAHCKVVIDNSGAIEDTYRQIKEKLEA